MSGAWAESGGAYQGVMACWAELGGSYRQIVTGWTERSGVWQKCYRLLDPVQTRVNASTTPDTTTTGSTTVPVGAQSLTIKLAGCGGNSWAGTTVGGGGGGGVTHTIGIAMADWGKTISYALKATSNSSMSLNSSSFISTVSSIALSAGVFSLQAYGGESGDNYAGGTYLGRGGSASGGNVANASGGSSSSTTGGASGLGDAGGANNTAGTNGGGAGATPLAGVKTLGGQAYCTFDWS